MKKRFFALLAVLALAFALCAAPACADGGSFIYGFENNSYDWVAEGDMLAQELYDEYGLAVCFAHEETLGNMTLEELSRSIYDAKAPAGDGFLLLDCDEASWYYIYYSGTANGIFTDADTESMCTAYNTGGKTYGASIRAYLLMAREIIARVTASDVPEGMITLPDGSLIPAERQLPRVVDNAAILDAETLARLNERADAVSEKYRCDVAVVLTDGTDGKTTENYAFDFYEANGYGYGDNDDGVMLVVDVTGRSYRCITHGFGAYAFTDAGQEYADGFYVPYLRDSDWAGAAEGFIGIAETLLTAARAGQPYDVGTIPKDPPGLTAILIAVAGGLITALIPIGVMKRKLESVSAKRSAESYVCKDSFRLKHSDDRFIRRYISKTPRPKSNDSDSSSGGGTSYTSSSSGRSYGSHGGSF